VNYQGLIPLIINSMNELTYKNIALSNRIKNLKKRITNNH